MAPAAEEIELGLPGHKVQAIHTAAKMRNEWIDGLRGLASLSVLTSHIARAFDYPSFFASDTPEVPMRVIQWPYFRLWTQGRIGVAIFGLVTGYVCAIKPLKQVRAGEIQAARDTLGKAILKRPMRLALPATLAALMAYSVAQLGFFALASKVDAEWIRKATPQQKPFVESIGALYRAIRDTWMTSSNYYDDHQWTLLPLLRGSLYTYFTVGAVANLRFKHRAMVYWLLLSFFWLDKRRDTDTFCVLTFYGLFLSDLSQQSEFQGFVHTKSWFRRVLSVYLIVQGLWIASYPQDSAEWQPWSRAMIWMKVFFPKDTWLPKRYTSLGLIIAAMGIMMNNSAKRFLSTKLIQFLARHSFAVYLTHGTILKSVLMWMVYGASGQTWDPAKRDGDGNTIFIPRCNSILLTFWVFCWFVIVYVAGWLWTTYVDLFCENISQWVLRKVYSNDLMRSYRALAT